ncbi:MAG: LysR family transcriptional regulator [Sandaracinaceae bacterium]
MAKLDWNLLPALHALLEEAHVTRAAARIGVTTPSMSRTLARLRATFGDPLLVRAGREMVRTPQAEALRDRVAALVANASELLVAEASLDAAPRTLVIRANDALAAVWLPSLVERMRARAPRVAVAFVGEGDERPEELRDGRVDLDVGVAGDDAPELRTQVLLRDTFATVVRRGHPLTRRPRSAIELTRYPHLGISRRGRRDGPIDVALHARGLSRDVVATVPSATAAANVVARTDWVTAMPSLVARALATRMPLAWLPLPLALPKIPIAQTWHPRLDRDPLHRALREALRSLASEVGASKAR